MLHWYIIFSFLSIEMALLVILVLPLPTQTKRPVIYFLAFLGRNTTTRAVLATVGGILSVIFLDCVRIMYQPVKGNSEPLLARQYASEKNAYLCGFALFFLFFLSRFQVVVNEMLQLEALAKVADESHPTTSKLLDEKQALEKKNERLKSHLVTAQDDLRELQKKTKVQMRGGE